MSKPKLLIVEDDPGLCAQYRWAFPACRVLIAGDRRQAETLLHIVLDRALWLRAPARAVHSIWFELLAEHGFPTFFAWVGLTLAGLAYALRLPRLVRGRPELAWAGDLGSMVQVCIVAYAVGGSFLSLSYWDYYWTILAVVAAAHALVLRSLRQEAPASAPAWRPSAGLAAPVPVGSGARRASVA